MKYYHEHIEAFRLEPRDSLPSADRYHLRMFMSGYLKAIEFTEGFDSSDELHGMDLTAEGEGAWGEGEIPTMLRDAATFMPMALGLVRKHVGLGGLYADGMPYGAARLAHDLWLTRNGHGAGFWDRKFTYGHGGAEIEGLGDELSALVGHGTAYPQLDAYKGDDGRAYLA